MSAFNRLGLGSKLAIVATPFLAVAMGLIAITLWMSWQLDGGAAAVNEAGRMRMQGFRLSLAIATQDHAQIDQYTAEFERSLQVLRLGDPERPLFVPWDPSIRERFDAVQQDWQRYRDRWADQQDATQPKELAAHTTVFADRIDALVLAIESRLSRWTAQMHLVQTVMLVLGLLGAAAIVFTGYVFVLGPVTHLRGAITRIREGDLSARVESSAQDEFGELARGFNDMAGHLQSMYRDLESKVRDKTAELEIRRERLETLYGVTTLVSTATRLDELAHQFAIRVRRVAHADAVALRWANESNERFILLAESGLPPSLATGEHCLQANQCHCGHVANAIGTRVIPIRPDGHSGLVHCEAAGFRTVVALPVRINDRLLGELDLFFHEDRELPPGERSLLEALNAHLASAMESLRLKSVEKEVAVSDERVLLARELHDSIAQSLAFLKIQVQLMRDALDVRDAERMRDVLAEIDLGVRESYGDVRELLMHFRTRASDEDITPALQTTLRKFEQLSGVKASLHVEGHGLPLAPDIQVQVLHIVQEALSNVRKHARASHVWLDIRQQPQWRFEVRDDGIGYDADDTVDETHVGRRIMGERAARIGATLEHASRIGAGTIVTLTLPDRAGVPVAAHNIQATAALPA